MTSKAPFPPPIEDAHSPVACREAFEQTAYCLDENQGDDGIYLDELTAINWLIWLVSWQVTIWNREAA